MFLVIDIGNTNIVAAVFDRDEIVKSWRIATDARRTGDEYSSIILSLFAVSKMSPSDITDVALSSVVPSLIGPFVSVCRNLCNKKPFIVSTSLASSGQIPVRLPDSSMNEMGTDLLCDAVGAWNLFHGCNIVVDFGTALTFTVTDSHGIIRGVDIAPGLGTALKSLASNAAQLPMVPLASPPSSLGMNTVESIQAGIVLGYKGLVEYLVSRIKEDLCAQFGENKEKISVVATGGLNSVLKPITDVFTMVDKNLTLNGLKEIYTCVNS